MIKTTVSKILSSFLISKLCLDQKCRQNRVNILRLFYQKIAHSRAFLSELVILLYSEIKDKEENPDNFALKFKLDSIFMRL